MVGPLVVLAIGARARRLHRPARAPLRPRRVEPARRAGSSPSLGRRARDVAPASRSASCWAVDGDGARRASASPALFYGGGYREPAPSSSRRPSRAWCRLVQDKFRIDELYGRRSSSGRSARLAEALFCVVDRVIIDKILVGGRGRPGRRARPHRPHRSRQRRRAALHGRVRDRRRRRWSTSPPARPSREALKVERHRPHRRRRRPAGGARSRRAASSTSSTSTTTASPR